MLRLGRDAVQSRYVPLNCWWRRVPVDRELSLRHSHNEVSFRCWVSLEENYNLLAYSELSVASNMLHKAADLTANLADGYRFTLFDFTLQCCQDSNFGVGKDSCPFRAPMAFR